MLADDLGPLFETILETIPPPSYDPEHPLQALVTNLDANPYVGRLALLRIKHGTLRKGAQVAWCRADGSVETARVIELFITEALDRVTTDEAGAGEIVALAGLPEITIGEDDQLPRRPAPAAGDDRGRAEPLDHDGDQHRVRFRASRATSSPRARIAEPARAGAGRQRLAAGAADLAPGRLGGAGPGRAPARRCSSS